MYNSTKGLLLIQCNVVNKNIRKGLGIIYTLWLAVMLGEGVTCIDLPVAVYAQKEHEIFGKKSEFRTLAKWLYKYYYQKKWHTQCYH